MSDNNTQQPAGGVQSMNINFNPDGSVNFTLAMGFMYVGFILPKERMIDFISAYRKHMKTLEVGQDAIQSLLTRGDLRA